MFDSVSSPSIDKVLLRRFKNTKLYIMYRVYGIKILLYNFQAISPSPSALYWAFDNILLNCPALLQKILLKF